MDWLGFSQMAEYSSFTLLHGIVHTGKPSYLSTVINNTMAAGTRTTANLNYHLPNFKKKISRLSFTYRAIAAYYSICAEVKTIKCKNNFKKKLKKLLKQKRPYLVTDQLSAYSKLILDGPNIHTLGTDALHTPPDVHGRLKQQDRGPVMPV